MKRMTTKRRANPVLRWVFRRGRDLLTCQLDREGHRGAYTLSLVPHWDVRQAAIERFDASIAAFRGHAAVANHLRAAGWTLAAYTLER
jgi:hypothetical protein